MSGIRSIDSSTKSYLTSSNDGGSVVSGEDFDNESSLLSMTSPNNNNNKSSAGDHYSIGSGRTNKIRLSSGSGSSIISLATASAAASISSGNKNYNNAGSSSIRPLAPSKRKTNSTKDFTIDKLNFDFLVTTTTGTTTTTTTTAATSKKKKNKKKLYGRSKEIQELQSVCRRMMMMKMSDEDEDDEEETETLPDDSKEQKKHQLVLISGYSGTGKTSLVIQSIRSMMLESSVGQQKKRNNNHLSSKKGHRRRGRGLLSVGKFNVVKVDHDSSNNNNNRNKPYSGIASACGDIVGQLLALKNDHHDHHDHRHQSSSSSDGDGDGDGASRAPTTEGQDLFNSIQSSILKEMGADDLRVISRAIPVLEELIVETNVVETTETTTPSTEQEHQSSAVSRSASATLGVGTAVDFASDKGRFNYAFQTFIQILSRHFELFIIVLDDLQWADRESLEILELVLSSSTSSSSSSSASSQNLMVVGIYRSNEVIETSLDPDSVVNGSGSRSSANVPIRSSSDFSETLNRLKQRSQQPNGFDITRIEVGNLEFDPVHELICDVLNMEPTPATYNLAESCYKRTLGNVFFLIQYLKLLHHRQLLRFNLGSLHWVWDVTEIERQTKASDNVADLLMAKMRAMDNHELRILQIAAFLGATFSYSTLSLVWNEIQQEEENYQQNHDAAGSIEISTIDQEQPESADASKLDDAIIAFEQEGYILLASSNDDDDNPAKIYSFSHDKIQEAALLSLPDDGFAKRQLETTIGTILVSKLSQTDLDTSAVFVAVNLLNEGISAENFSPGVNDRGIDTAIKSVIDKKHLSSLNLHAAQKAVSLSAFESAAEYAKKGISLLDKQTMWNDDCYDLTLELYTIGTEAEGFLGNVETTQRYYEEVVSAREHDKPMADKLRVYTVWFDSVANRGKPDEACAMAIELLRKFDSKFPTTKAGLLFQIVRNIVKVKKLLRSGKIHDIKKLPVLEDPTRLRLMLILDKLSTHLYTSENELMPLAVFRQLSWTRKYGLSDFSAPALGTTGIMLAGVLEDLQGSRVVAHAALELVDMMDNNRKGGMTTTRARTWFIIHCLVLHWTEPLRNQLKPTFDAYSVALRSGDTETACWAIQNHYLIRYFTGTSLQLLVSDLPGYCAQMKELAREKAYRLTIINLQMYINFTGETDDMMKLFGDVITEQELQDWVTSDSFFRSAYKYWECYLATLYGDHERCASLSIDLELYSKSAPGTFMTTYEALVKGVSYFAAATTTRDRDRRKSLSYAKMGYQLRRRVKSWIEKGNPNLGHIESILDAEEASYKGRKYVARQKYELSILLAARSGLMMEAGFASERFGEYYRSQKGGGDEFDDDAEYQFSQSIKYYRDVGAYGLARHLEEKHSDLFSMHAKMNGNHEHHPVSEILATATAQ